MVEEVGCDDDTTCGASDLPTLALSNTHTKNTLIVAKECLKEGLVLFLRFLAFDAYHVCRARDCHPESEPCSGHAKVWLRQFKHCVVEAVYCDPNTKRTYLSSSNAANCADTLHILCPAHCAAIPISTDRHSPKVSRTHYTVSLTRI